MVWPKGRFREKGVKGEKNMRHILTMETEGGVSHQSVFG